MSGIFGFVLNKNSDGIRGGENLLLRMHKALPLDIAIDDDRYVSQDGRVGLGAVHAANIGHPVQYAYDEKNQLVCLLDGYCYTDEPYPEKPVHVKAGAEFLIERYLEKGPKCLSAISGSFNVAWYELKADRLILATDKIGQRLAFYGTRNGHFIFGSYIASIMAAKLLSTEIDVAAFANLLRTTYPPGDDTLFLDVKCLPAGTTLIFEKGDMTLRKYWGIDHVEPHGNYNGQRLDEIEAVFKTAVYRAMTSGVDTAIGLTGGLDSRCILAAAANMKLPFLTYTGGQSNSTDVVIARQAAQAVGYEHFFEQIGPDKMVDWLLPMVKYQGGMDATLHSHPCQHFEIPFPFGAYIQGIGISYIRGQWVLPELMDITAKNDVLAALKKKILFKDIENIGFINLWGDAYQKNAADALDNSLEQLFADFEVSDRPIAFLDFYALDQKCRKFLNKANVIIRNVRENYFPYLDHELLTAVARLPIKERITNRIQIDMIKRQAPELMKVPLAKTLQPIPQSSNPGWVAETYHEVKQKITRKLGLAEQMTFEPNHYLYQWSRREMRQSLEKLLFNPKAAFRKYLDWDAIEPILTQHFAGRHNWETILGGLVVFEICHHLWVDHDLHADLFSEVE